MRYTTVSHTIKSSDGIHDLNGIIYLPIGTPKATVQIIHGLCEHIELYDEFMSELAKNGIVCFAHDQLGHGRTAFSIDDLGKFADKNGDDLLIIDAHRFSEEFIGEFTCMKHFVFGHSMGSFPARICSELFPEMADGLILAGTSGPQRAAPLGIAFTDIKSKVLGGDHRSESDQQLCYGIYNHEFRDEKRDYSWLSCDSSVIDDHEKDEYFNFTFSVKAMNDVVRLCSRCNTDEWFAHYSSDCPALIISGENDPLGNFGKGALETYKRMSAVAGDNITFKLYRNARHELLHDHCRYSVMSDILTWIQSNY